MVGSALGMTVTNPMFEAVDRFSKLHGVKQDFGTQPRVSVHRACGAASRGVVQQGGWPAPNQWRSALRKQCGNGTAPPMSTRGREVDEVGGARALGSSGSRKDQ